MADRSTAMRKVVLDLSLFALSQVVLYFGVKWALASLDPTRQRKLDARRKTDRLRDRLGAAALSDLTDYEQVIASEVIFPADIPVTFHDIGGLEPIVDSLKESVIYPLCFPQLYQSASGLLGSPRGVLLYGPPGCGKTMLAKAIARESGATFINLHVSTLTEKWFGESQKLVNGLFSLARKLQPAIIFIDEIDSFLRDRKSTDHEAMSMMKAEFMTLWDGLATGSSRIVILGATNRPSDIDKAILRRMPKQFRIALPSTEQRLKILRLLLRDVALEDNFDLAFLAERTQGLSGSDLRELCRNAAMLPVREAIRTMGNVALADIDVSKIKTRKLRINDFYATDSGSIGITPIVETDVS